MSHHDLRSFLDQLERERQLLRVSAPVDPHLESTSLSLRALREQGPALLMEQPCDARHALLGNLFGHRRRIELSLAGRPLASLRELGRLLASIKEPRWPSSLRQALATWPELAQLAHVAPRRTTEAAFQYETLHGPDIDLSRLPIQQCWPGDAGKLITFGLVITRGTRQLRQNVAVYRQQVIGANRVIMRWLPHRGGALDFADWQAVHPERPFPVLVAIGADPATMLAAVAPVPDTLSEYEFAGLLRGQRTRTWHSKLTDLDAPAGAEILLEGFIHPRDTALEGPFGDHTGYYNAQDHFPVLTIERMHLRRDAIYQELMGYSFRDYFTKFALPYHKARGVSEAEFRHEADLRNSGSGLRSNPKVRVIVNRNDFLLGPGDIGSLRSTVGGGRVTVFPNGGHLGNVGTPQVRKAVLDAVSGLR